MPNFSYQNIICYRIIRYENYHENLSDLVYCSKDTILVQGDDILEVCKSKQRENTDGKAKVL